MSNLRQVAQQALEALWYYHATEFSKDTHAGKAIAVLQAALAEQEQEPVVDCPRCGHCCPQRKPLTATTILDMMPGSIPAEYDGSLMNFARAIEAAHGIKGEA